MLTILNFLDVTWVLIHLGNMMILTRLVHLWWFRYSWTWKIQNGRAVETQDLYKGLKPEVLSFKNEVLRVSHFSNYSKLRTSTPPNLHFYKEAGSKVRKGGLPAILLNSSPTSWPARLPFFLPHRIWRKKMEDVGRVPLSSCKPCDVVETLWFGGNLVMWWNDFNIKYTLNILWTHSEHTLNTLGTRSEHALNTLWTHSEHTLNTL